MTRIAVTGGSGKAGRATVRDLLDHGYDVTNLDRVESPDPVAPLVVVDLTDPDAVREALSGHDAVVHLAAIPTPRGRFDEPTFRNNIMSTYNVLCLAAELEMQRIVWASSETVLGLPFESVRPPYAPLDEAWPQHPETGYALAKAASELIAAQIARWSGIPIVGLRFSNVMEPERYAQFPTFWEDPHARKWNLWGYIDARDAAQAVELPSSNYREGIPFTDKEVIAIWTSYAQGSAFAAYILLMIYTGMMPVELRRCTVSNIDWTNKLITGVGAKTKKRKETPIVLADAILPVLADICDRSETGRLLEMGDSKFYRMFYATVKAAGGRVRPSCPRPRPGASGRWWRR